ncbi:MAG: hypothetical protein QOI86_5109, partial [Actinomycetota bacterium]|nr:hypothetical protein [Actinomycetota bacterium]
MFFEITSMYFAVRPRGWVAPGAAAAWNGVATPGEIGRPGDLPVTVGQQLRRWGALLALAGLALPGLSAQAAHRRPPAVAVLDASRSVGPNLPGAAGDDAAPATAAPWEAGVVEADGKPLPTAPPPGPVPVEGIPLPGVAAPTTASTVPPPAAPKVSPNPGETVRLVPNQSVAGPAGPTDDLVPADREYLRPILIRYAQENGLPADLVMALAWVESSWRRTAVSDAGAVGVMQLMPRTVQYVSRDLLGLKSNLDPRNPTSNVRMG